MNNKALFAGFKRLQNFPLDPTSRFETRVLLEEYVEGNKLAYAGQQLAVYKDVPENNGLYEIIEIDGKLKILKTVSDKEIDEIYRQWKEFSKDITDKVDNYKNDIDQALLKQYENIKNLLDERFEIINELMHKYDEVDEHLNSIKEIADWIDDNEQYLDLMAGVHRRLQEQIDILIGKVEELKNADYITEEDVINIVGNTNLNTASKTLTIPFSVDGGLRQGEVYNDPVVYTLPNGHILENIIVSVDKAEGLQNYFNVYGQIDGGSRIELVRDLDINHDTGLDYDFEHEYTYTIDENGKLVESNFNTNERLHSMDFSKEKRYEFPIYREFLGADSTSKFTFTVEVSSETQCSGNVFISYFKKV